MVAAPSLFPIEPAAEEQRLVVSGVPWETYVVLREALDHTNLRMTYLEGTLEILSPSRRHEVEKKQIARFLELFCLERDIPLFAYGSTTRRSEAKARGLEADECYSRGERELPEIAIEVIVSHGSVDKLEVYRGLGVREIWLFEGGAHTGAVAARRRLREGPIERGVPGGRPRSDRAVRDAGRSACRAARVSRRAPRSMTAGRIR